MNNRSNKGFSLVELLVSIAVMSIIMVMVVQMMGNSSVSLRKTKKKLELQNEVLEFREQFSDIIMQANYIRVQSEDGKKYTLNTDIDPSIKNGRKRVETSAGDIQNTLVSDSYPNYTKAGDNNFDIYMNQGTFTLYGEDASKNKTAIDDTIQSFRVLTDSVTTGIAYYVKPSYIYVRYQTDNAAKEEQYAIFRFLKKDGKYKVYAAKGKLTNIDTLTNDGFNTAETAVTAKSGKDGLMSDKVNDVYFSADVASNTVFVDMQFENAKYINQTYEYRDTITLRNSNALSVSPSKMFLKKTSP